MTSVVQAKTNNGHRIYGSITQMYIMTTHIIKVDSRKKQRQISSLAVRTSLVHDHLPIKLRSWWDCSH